MEWPMRTIGDFVREGEVSLQTGPFGAQLHAHDYLPVGVSVVPTEGIRDKKIDHAVLPKISAAKALELSRHRLIENDILFARRGVQATGRTAIVTSQESDFICGTGAIRLRVIKGDGEIDAQFLAHLLSSEASIAWLKFHAIGATMPNLNEGIIRSFPFQVPPKPVQYLIAELLSALDDKFEVNRRINETLEASARALFRDWFIDFGPTCAKAEGRPAWLAPDLWSLFPDRLGDDGVPEGWSFEALGEVTNELRRGLSPAYLAEGGICVLNQKCIRDTSINLAAARRHDSQRKSVTSRLIEAGDILVNSTGVGTLGRVAQIWRITEPTVVDSHVTVVRADPKRVSPYVLGTGLLQRQAEIEALGEGSTGQTELSRARLGGLQILVPSVDVQQAFDRLVKPLVAAVSANQGESHTLAATRDALLPKLMSGEIRVREAEALVA